MKNIKRLISIVLITIYLFNPISVFACGGIDKYGELYTHIHDYTNPNLPMLYARKNHIYIKEVKMNNGDYTDIDEDYIISELYTFPIVQDKETYVSYYIYVDEILLNNYWENLDDLDIKTTVEGIDNLLVTGADFKLNIGLKNTFQQSKIKYFNSKVKLMYYNIEAKRLSLDETDKQYIDAKKKISNRELKQVVSEILRIESRINYLNNDMNNTDIGINTLYDKIEVQISSSQNAGDVVAINLNNLTLNNVIPAVYDNEVKAYKFEIEETGIYTLVNSDFDKDLFVSTFDNEEKKAVIDNVTEDPKEEKEQSNSIIIIVIIAGIIILTATVVIIKRKK